MRPALRSRFVYAWGLVVLGCGMLAHAAAAQTDAGRSIVLLDFEGDSEVAGLSPGAHARVDRIEESEVRGKGAGRFHFSAVPGRDRTFPAVVLQGNALGVRDFRPFEALSLWVKNPGPEAAQISLCIWDENGARSFPVPSTFTIEPGSWQQIVSRLVLHGVNSERIDSIHFFHRDRHRSATLLIDNVQLLSPYDQTLAAKLQLARDNLEQARTNARGLGAEQQIEATIAALTMRLDRFDNRANAVEPALDRSQRLLELAQLTTETEQLADAITVRNEGTNVILAGPHVQADWLNDADKVQNITTLRLFHTRLGKEGLSKLVPARGLETLIILGNQFSGAGLDQMTGEKLTQLFLGNTRVHDENLLALRRFSGLQDLRLQNTDVTSGLLVTLAGLSQLVSLNLSGTKVSDDQFSAIANLTRLESLVLDRTGITGGSLRHLERLVQLKSLDLRQTRINDTGLAHLRGLVNLESLLIGNTPVTGAAFAQLASLEKLVTLDLNGTRVGDTALRQLGDLSRLTRLELSGTPITDASLQYIGQSAKLAYLDLYGTNITDAGLAHLHEQKGLEELYLGGTQVSAEGLRHLAEMKELRSLDLDGTEISDEGLKHLQSLTNLVTLKLGNTRITGEGLVHLAGLSELRTLDLAGTNVGDTGLAPLSRLENLRTLRLSGTRVTSQGMQLLQGAAQIAVLDVAATNVDDEGLEKLTALANLSELNVSETAVTDAGCAHLKRMQQLNTILLNHTQVGNEGLSQLGDGYVALELTHTPVTDLGIEHLQRQTHLVQLRLASTAVTDRGLRLLQAMPNLQVLDLAETGIGDAGLEYLIALPGLQELNLNGTRVTDAGIETLLMLTGLQRISLENSRITSQGASFLKQRAPELEVRLVFPWTTGKRWSHYPLLSETPLTTASTNNLLGQLKKLKSLAYLHVHDRQLIPAFLRGLKDLPALEHVSFRGTSIADDHLAELHGLARIAGLDLSHTRITDEGLFHLRDMQGLRELNLAGTQVTGRGLLHLAGLSRLWELILPASVHDAGLAHIGRLANLKKLGLGGTRLTDRGVKHLLPLVNLQYLDLYGTALTDAGLEKLSRLNSLRYLYLSHTAVTDQGIEFLQGLTDLEELGLDGTGLSDRGLKGVASLLNLRRLRIGRTRVTESGLAQVARLHRLARLELNHLPITDGGIDKLSSLANLRHLDLSGTAITDRALQSLDRFPALTTLHLWDTQLTPQAIEEFRRAHRGINVEYGMSPSRYSRWSWLILTAFGLSAIAICLYGAHRYWLVWLFLRDKDARISPEPLSRFKELPAVTVQLPLYNERHVAERVISAACALDYPRERLQIQVLDDSTDQTVEIARRACQRMESAGHNIEYIHRPTRNGFKGGALEAGLRTASGEYVAVFDADFVPPTDILQNTIHHFTHPRVGLVQAEWSHLNRQQSLLTECQAMFLDGHFVVEQTVRCRHGRWFNFNGTAGIWKRTCIEDAGGWQHDTLTEDTDLSYRAQINGWKFVYLPSVKCGAELPRTMTAFLGQQHRWTKGLIQTGVKLLPRILRSTAPWKVKLEAWFHLTSPVMYLVMFIVSAIALPALFLATPLVHWHIVALSVGAATLALGTCAAATFYILSQRAQGLSLARTLLRLPVLMALGIGMCAVNARAVLEALAGLQSPFVRTPKFGGRADCDRDPEIPRRRWRFPPGWLELVLSGVLFACLILSFVRPFTLIGAPFLFLFAAGYLGVGLSGLLDYFGRAPSPAEPRRLWRLGTRFAVAMLAIVLLASVSGGTLFVSLPSDHGTERVAEQPTSAAVNLTTANWRIRGGGSTPGSAAGAIREIFVDRESVVLSLHLDATTDEGEMVLELDGALQPLGDSLGSGRELSFEVEFPSRFTGEFQAFARDAQHKSQYGSIEFIESRDPRRSVTVAIAPTVHTPPMGYQDEGFDPARGICEIGLKISAQSDRVRGIGYQPFRGSVRIATARISDPVHADDLQPELIVPDHDALIPLPEVAFEKFLAESGVDRPWPLGYSFSGPLTDAHADELESTYAAIARLGCKFTRVYLGDYRTGLLYDGEGRIAGVEPAFLEYVDTLAAIANRHGLTVMFSLTDNTMVDGRGVERIEFIRDGQDSKLFIDRVVAQFISTLATREVIWDVFNEPENATAVPLREIQGYVDRVLRAGRRADPKARFTVVSRGRDDLVFWQGRGLDLHSHNIFTLQSLAAAMEAPRRLDAPVMVAEMAPELATQTHLESLRRSGYLGVGIWGWDTRDKYHWEADDLSNVVEPLRNLTTPGP